MKEENTVNDVLAEQIMAEWVLIPGASPSSLCKHIAKASVWGLCD